MHVAHHARSWRRISQLAAIVLFLVPLNAIAGGQRPAIHQIQMQGETLTNLTVSASGGTVAQEGVAAAIYRSTGCGFQSWIGGQPAWLDEIVLFNEGSAGAALRSYSAQVCYDTCHRGARCLSGPDRCDCLSCDKFPFNANLQLYDGDPCGSGIAIAGTQGTITITEADIPCDQLGDGDSHCFTLTVNVDPKVQIPHDTWIEALYGIDDSWPLVGRPNDAEGQGDSPLSGLNDGIDCDTFCDNGGPLCTNDPDRCDWLLASADANAEFAFRVHPTGSTGGGTIVGNEITLTRGGQTVFLDIRVDDWISPDIESWQAGIDSSGYTSALKGTLTAAVIPCLNGQGDCDALHGGGSICGDLVAGECPSGYIDESRTDYIFSGATEFNACFLFMSNHFCASTLLVGRVTSPGRSSYLWTLAVDVSPGAKGTFTIPPVLPPGSALLSTDGFLKLVGVVPALITIPIGRCCSNFGKECIDGVNTAECETVGGTFVADLTCGDPCPTTGACCDALPPGGECAEDVEQTNCNGMHLTWTAQTTCNATVCDEVAGACCVEGVCTENVPRSQCQSEKWAQDATCNDPIITEPCAFQARIPTVSTWGVIVLTLLLLAGAKIYFGRVECPAT